MSNGLNNAFFFFKTVFFFKLGDAWSYRDSRGRASERKVNELRREAIISTGQLRRSAMYAVQSSSWGLISDTESDISSYD